MPSVMYYYAKGTLSPAGSSVAGDSVFNAESQQVYRLRPHSSFQNRISALLLSPTNQTITLYDLAGKEAVKYWSSNPQKLGKPTIVHRTSIYEIQYALLFSYVRNYKKIPYQSTHLDLGKVGSILKAAGFPSSPHQLDGTPVRTVPSIFDDATGERVADSYKIGEDLDKRYPQAFLPETESLQAAFYQQFRKDYLNLQQCQCLAFLAKEPSLGDFNNIAVIFGKSMDQFKPVGNDLEKLWGKLYVFFDAIDGQYAKSPGRYLVGDEPSFRDFTVASSLGMTARNADDPGHHRSAE